MTSLLDYEDYLEFITDNKAIGTPLPKKALGVLVKHHGIEYFTFFGDHAVACRGAYGLHTRVFTIGVVLAEFHTTNIRTINISWRGSKDFGSCMPTTNYTVVPANTIMRRLLIDPYFPLSGYSHKGQYHEVLSDNERYKW